MAKRPLSQRSTECATNSYTNSSPQTSTEPPKTISPQRVVKKARIEPLTQYEHSSSSQTTYPPASFINYSLIQPHRNRQASPQYDPPSPRSGPPLESHLANDFAAQRSRDHSQPLNLLPCSCRSARPVARTIARPVRQEGLSEVASGPESEVKARSEQMKRRKKAWQESQSHTHRDDGPCDGRIRLDGSDSKGDRIGSDSVNAGKGADDSHKPYAQNT